MYVDLNKMHCHCHCHCQRYCTDIDICLTSWNIVRTQRQSLGSDISMLRFIVMQISIYVACRPLVMTRCRYFVGMQNVPARHGNNYTLRIYLQKRLKIAVIAKL